MMITFNLYAQEDCKISCNVEWRSYDMYGCLQICRAANILERIESNLTQKESGK